MPLSVKALSYPAWAVAGVRASAQTSTDLAPAASHAATAASISGASGDHIIDQRNVLALRACRSYETIGVVLPSDLLYLIGAEPAATACCATTA